MATINPLQAPINYMGMIPQVNLGQEFAEFGQALAQRQERIKKQEFQKQYSQDLQSAIATPTQKTWNDMIAKYPQQREAFESARKGYGEERLTNEFNQGFAVSAALENNKPEIAKAELQKTIEARKNSGQQTQIYQQAFDALEAGNVTGAQAIVNMALSTADPERFKKTVESQTTAKQAPSLVSESAAKAEEAVAAATIAKANATNAAENAKADAQLKAANAAKAKVESDYAEKEILSRLKQSAAATGASNASIARSMAEVKNLNTTGKMLRLDWEAASQGLVMPSKRTEGGKPAPTEDERKTAVNLAQATNAYKNMLNAMYTKEGKKTGAEKPESIESIPFYIGSALGGITRSTKREQFNQSASSLAEALLRVSTGAGITKDEAEQKIKEITPLYTDDQATRDQKLASIPEYLKAIQVRAGRALPEDYKIPQVPTEQSRNVTVDY